MADLKIKATSGNLVLADDGGDAAITVASNGTTTFAENATLSGSANNIGTTTAGTLSSGVTFPTGHVLQVVQSTATASLTLTSTTFVTSGLSAAITPASTSNKVLVTYSITMDSDANGAAAWFALYAGGSSIVGKSHYIHGASSRIITSAALTYLHSPSTTSAITYELMAKKMSGTQVYTRYGDTMSTMTLMEIKG